MNLNVTMKCEECSSDKCVTKNLRQHVQANYDGPRVAFLSVVFDFLGNCGLRDGGHRKRTTSDSNDRVVEKITQQCAQAGGMSGSPTAALVESEDLKLEFSCALEQQQQRLCGTMVGAL